MTERPTRNTTPETRSDRFVTVNPKEVVRDNPAFISLTPGAIRGSFDIERYNREAIAEYVQVVDRKGGVRFLPYDGHNRTEAASKADIKELTVRDSTLEVLSDHFPDSTATTLSTTQYIERMRVLNDIEGKLDEKRMVGQMFNEWKLNVGSDLAGRTSAFAALHILSFSELRDKNPDEIKRIFENPKHNLYPGPLVFDETPEEKRELIEGIVGMASSVENVKISYQDVLHHGLWVVYRMLISEDSDIRDSGEKQVRGLLSLPKIHEKIATVSDDSLLEQRRSNLEQLVVASIRNIDMDNRSVHPTQVTRTLYNIMTNPDYKYGDVASILRPLMPGELPRSLRQRDEDQRSYLNIKSVTDRYQRYLGDSDIPEVAINLIQQITGGSKSSEAQEKRIVASVETTVGLLRKTERLITVDETSFPSHLRGELRSIISQIKVFKRRIDDATSLPSLNTNANKLTSKLSELEGIMARRTQRPLGSLLTEPPTRATKSTIAPAPAEFLPASTKVGLQQETTKPSALPDSTALEKPRVKVEPSVVETPVENTSAEIVVYPPLSKVSLEKLIAEVQERAGGELSDADVVSLVALKNYLKDLFPDAPEAQAPETVPAAEPVDSLIKDPFADPKPAVQNILPLAAVTFQAPTIEKPESAGPVAETPDQKEQEGYQDLTKTAKTIVQNATEVLGSDLEQKSQQFLLVPGIGEVWKSLHNNGKAQLFRNLADRHSWDMTQPELKYMSASLYYNAVLKAIETRRDQSVPSTELAPLDHNADAMHIKLVAFANDKDFSIPQRRLLQLYPELKSTTTRTKISDNLVTNPSDALDYIFRMHPNLMDKFVYKPLQGKPENPDSGSSAESSTEDPVWAERRKSYRPDTDGKGRWFADIYKKNSTTLSETHRYKVTFMVESAIKKTFGSLSKDILSTLSDGAGNTGLTAIDTMLSERIARLSSDVDWNRDKAEFQYLIAKFVQHALSVPERPTLTKDQMELLKTKVESKKYNKEKSLKYTSDPYLFLLEFILCIPPNEPQYNSMAFKLRTGMDTNDARGFVLKHVADSRQWRSPSLYNSNPQRDKDAAADRQYIVDKLDALYRSTILNQTATIEDNADN